MTALSFNVMPCLLRADPPQNIELRKNIAQERTDKKDIEQCRVFCMCPRNKKIVQEP